MNRQQARGGTQALAGTGPAAWGLYFADGFEQDDRRAVLIRDLAQHFAAPAGWQQLAAARAWHARCLLELDWQQLVAATGSRDLQEAMLHAPAEALACIACAAYEVGVRAPFWQLLRSSAGLQCRAHSPRSQVLFRVNEAATRQALPELQPAKVLVRLVNAPDALRLISSIKADAIGRLVCVRGTVVRATAPTALITELEFVCGKCGAPQSVAFPDGRYAPPPACGQGGCRSRTLVPNRSTASCIDWQRLALQGLPKDERGSVGRVPVPIGVEVAEDLVGAAVPGDVATVVGIVRVSTGEPSGGGKKGGDPKRQCIFLPYIEAVSVCVAGKENRRPGQGEAGCEAGGGGGAGGGFLPPNMPGFSRLDLEFIATFTEACEGDQLRQLAHSLCPSIFGHELVKAGLLLALLGGVRKGAGAEGQVALRGDVHVLLVGDPGLGKSQLLQACAAAAPRGVYVCGNTSSAAGLTVSVVREGGEFAFDAGALVLADRGVCCIDEFDKMRADHAALLGAMEQQEVAVAKAGLVAALPARTTVLAAANPAEGSYNRGRTLLENLRMSPAMLSRFDLTFLLLDTPDAERDQRLSAHVMALHSGVAARAAAARSRLLEGGAPPPLLLAGGAAAGGRPSLLERLRVRRQEDEPLPTQLLRKYIAYARQYVHPRLSDEAAAVIKAYYLQLRAAGAADPGALPVTARQLESLVRLSEARARAELREEVTREDAEDVVEIMQQTLDGLSAGPAGLECLDFTCGGGGGRAGSQAAERRRFLQALARHCQAKGDALVEGWELQDVADRVVLQVPSLQALVAQLNEAGDLLKKGGGRFQVCGVALHPAPQYSGAAAGGGGAAMDVGPAFSQLTAGSKRSYHQSQQEQQQQQPPPPPRW